VPTKLTAFRTLRSIDRNVLDHAKTLASDSSPAIRREVAVAMRDVPLKDCQDILVKLAQGYDGKDRFYLEAFGEACDGKEEAIYPILQKQMGNDDAMKWSDAFTGIAWRLHPKAAIDGFAKRAAASELSLDQRKQATIALAFINDEKAAEAMASLAKSSGDDLRPLATWWMTNRVNNDWKEFHAARHFSPANAPTDGKQPDAEAVARFEKARASVIDDAGSPYTRIQAVNRLALDPEGGKFLISLAAEGKFPKQFMENVTDRIYKNPDLTVRALASQYFPRKAAGGNALPPLKELAAMTGDAKRGHDVFFGNTASCFKCHKFNGEGKDVGPDLTAIRTKYQRPEFLDSVLSPSAAIAFGYEAWIVKTKKNDVYSGFIIADGENVTLKEGSGEQRVIPASEIVLRKKQTMSVMPDNVALGLTAQELADLTEFVLKSPVPAATTAKPAQ
jgi:putative heme-binding domain-containing protein